MARPVKATVELGEYSSRTLRLLVLAQGGTLTSAAKAMIDLGCSTAAQRVDAMCAAICPAGQDLKEWQDKQLQAMEEE